MLLDLLLFVEQPALRDTIWWNTPTQGHNYSTTITATTITWRNTHAHSNHRCFNYHSYLGYVDCFVVCPKNGALWATSSDATMMKPFLAPFSGITAMESVQPLQKSLTNTTSIIFSSSAYRIRFPFPKPKKHVLSLLHPKVVYTSVLSWLITCWPPPSASQSATFPSTSRIAINNLVPEPSTPHHKWNLGDFYFKTEALLQRWLP